MIVVLWRLTCRAWSSASLQSAASVCPSSDSNSQMCIGLEFSAILCSASRIGMYDGNSDCGRSCSCMFGRSDLILGEDRIVRRDYDQEAGKGSSSAI